MSVLTNGRPACAPAEPPNPALCNAPRVLEVDARLVDAPPGNPEVTLEDVQHDLLPSMREHGQLINGVIFAHPEKPGRWLAADCNRRAFCCRILGVPLKAVALAEPPTEPELITIRVTANGNRKAMDKAQLAADVFTWLEITGKSQAEAAENFNGLSQGYISKLVAPFKNGVPELIAALKARQIVPTAAPFIASLSHEQQREVLPKVLGRKRSAVEAICGAYRPRKERGKAKPLKFKAGCLDITAKNPTPEGVQAGVEAVSAALKKIAKENLPLSVLPSLLKLSHQFIT